MRYRLLLLASLLTLLLAVGCGAVAAAAQPAAAVHAQPAPSPPVSATPTPRAAIQLTATASPAPTGQLQLAISKTLQGSDLVKVGQPLNFTIQITNTGSITVTKLPLIDEFDPAILQPLLPGFSRQPDLQASGKLTWTDLADVSDLGPGQTITVITSFRAIKISDQVINRARIEGAQGVGGAGGAPLDTSDKGQAEGGRVIVQKALVPGLIKLDAPVISFTVTLRNDGAADIVSAPLEDTYRPDVLRFRSSVPPPDRHDPATGALRWNDLLASLGVPRLRPSEVITLTTSYTVTGDIADAVVNSADAVGVRDEFGNAVASPRRAEVRIRIVGVGAQTPTLTPAPTRRPRNTATPSEIMTPTSTDAACCVPTALTPTSTDAALTPTSTDAACCVPTALTPTSTDAALTPISTDAACCVPTSQTPAQPNALPKTDGGSGPGTWLLLIAALALLLALLLRREVRR